MESQAYESWQEFPYHHRLSHVNTLGGKDIVLLPDLHSDQGFRIYLPDICLRDPICHEASHSAKDMSAQAPSHSYTQVDESSVLDASWHVHPTNHYSLGCRSDPVHLVLR